MNREDISKELFVLVNTLKKESIISRPRPSYQLVDRYNDKSLVYKNVYKREVGYHSQFVKVGILKEDNVISFNDPNKKLEDKFNWYEPGF